ncbi:MAG: NGG1p interacting factor NIF3 [Lentisphaerota bacterium]
MAKYYKVEFYVPATHLEEVKNAVFDAGGGRLGNYDNCCWQSEGVGQFRPCPGSRPFIGAQGAVEQVSEFKVEFICGDNFVKQVIAALKKAHPYETPAYQYWAVKIEN